MHTESTNHAAVPADTRPTAEPTLADLMGSLSRRVSFNLAAGTCMAAIIGVAVLLTFFSGHWRLVLAGVVTACASGWTMSEHERSDSPVGLSQSWRIVRSVSAVVGVAAAFALLLSMLSLALGTWIS